MKIEHDLLKIVEPELMINQSNSIFQNINYITYEFFNRKFGEISKESW